MRPSRTVKKSGRRSVCLLQQTMGVSIRCQVKSLSGIPDVREQSGRDGGERALQIIIIPGVARLVQAYFPLNPATDGHSHATGSCSPRGACFRITISLSRFTIPSCQFILTEYRITILAATLIPHAKMVSREVNYGSTKRVGSPPGQPGSGTFRRRVSRYPDNTDRQS